MCCFTQSIHTLHLSVGGLTDGRTDAWTHGRTDGRADGRTDGRMDGGKIFTQYSGISSCSVGSTYMSEATFFACYLLFGKTLAIPH